MKCPKCGYIGFENADKCRNCGYDFSLVTDPLREIDLPLRRDEPLQAPADFEFRTGDTPRPGAAPRVPNSDFELPAPTPQSARELPLFRPPSGTSQTPPRPLASLQRTSSTPSTPIVRPRPGAPSPRPRPVPAAFDFKEAEPGLQPETPPTPARTRTAAAPHATGSVARAVAGVLDAMILSGLDAGVLYFTLRVCRLTFAETTILPLAPLIAFFLLLDGAYLIAFTAVGGQTIGKMASGLKVISEDGDTVVASQAAVRAVGYLVSWLPAGLGFVPGLFGPSRRALHDRIANTRVVRA